MWMNINPFLLDIIFILLFRHQLNSVELFTKVQCEKDKDNIDLSRDNLWKERECR